MIHAACCCCCTRPFGFWRSSDSASAGVPTPNSYPLPSALILFLVPDPIPDPLPYPLPYSSTLTLKPIGQE
jgi:hypothetical protein